MESLTDWQVQIEQHNFPALWYELIASMAAQEVMNSLPSVFWLLSLFKTHMESHAFQGSFCYVQLKRAMVQARWNSCAILLAYNHQPIRKCENFGSLVSY